jgi:hypothetical protein
MRSGQLEVMLNRRTALSDELGNPEKMDEQEGGAGAGPAGLHAARLTPVCLHSHERIMMLVAAATRLVLPPTRLERARRLFWITPCSGFAAGTVVW